MIKKCVILYLLLGGFGPSSASKCDRTPDGYGAGKSPADARFVLRITGNPEKYTPGEQYIITLAGIRSMQVVHKFIGFMLAVEKEGTDLSNNFMQPSVGSFELTDSTTTRFSEKCPNLVTHTTSLAKGEVQVAWTAPPPGSKCVAFRATVIEHRDVWYMDDGPLSRIFCEDEQDLIDFQPTVFDPCCACNEAKYEMTFEGLWSRHTHPKDYPSNSWLTRFSDIIGATHAVDYRFWEYGRSSSIGLQQVAEHGSTRQLETELKEESDHIRTIIKARGISYPNVTGKTFAVFRVDNRHHLISLVSMIDPSPDWFVGVSGLELCTANCSWVESKVINLFPWDAGTDSGPTYISPDQPTNPPDVIRRIKADFPNDPRSPFYDTSGIEMKPFARLSISRQRLYEKTCENAVEQESDVKACKTTKWGEFGECDVKCGRGNMHRQRQYVNPSLASSGNCNKKLTERKKCEGTDTDCEDNEQKSEEEPTDVLPECALTDWSEWSSCSATCGKGSKTKSRAYINRSKMKKCQRGSAKPPKLELNQECFGTDCGGDIQPDSKETNPECVMTPWSNWGQCSVTCGTGKKMRTRMPNVRGKLTYTHNMAYSPKRNKNRMSSEDDEEDEDSPCYGVSRIEEVECYMVECDTPTVPYFCYLSPDVGNCRVATQRWYYDRASDECAMFSYGGCNGNENSFMSNEKCLETCRRPAVEDLEIQNQYKEPDYSEDHVDCKVSDWQRGPCNATCGEGYRVKVRTVIVFPKNKGKQCPKRLVRMEKCHTHCDTSVNHPQEKLVNQHKISDKKYGRPNVICSYSKWSDWTPCSKSCGDDAIQRRTRTVLNADYAMYCLDRMQERNCLLLPCLLRS